ncbi:peptidyl-tRNA hydrolase 2 [Grosmannia clavigera kw1407]|uniref:peptidyl-tRNA hydrolase n=1 Tax=Grosmannia clavigera (strain kw1407 / UAMH 11150) TaxID=655863 RepID=F0XP44_GROCL|nr:peptidyl-tRNA hydrolase 2 [Grosmannia clavigera kw1407]EFX00688.1 peptidyl-tRNA hydrolase 2 [Grosmannia clavigera kw1407]
MAAIDRVLVVSLGNPAPYRNTLHSAGHLALEALRRELQLPPFASRRIGRQAAQVSPVSAASRYTLAQSPTLMNVSGPWVARAWEEVLRGSSDATGAGLIVLHDDLEEALGVVKIRPWERSHRGHNGLKSINASLRRSVHPAARWAKLSVGIGRPDTRDRSSVSDYVLRPLDGHEKTVLGSQVGAGVLAAVQAIEASWAAQQ